MAKKFVEVTGLHKVFPELSDSSLDLTQIIENVSDKINHNSILFMTADASDASYGFPEDSKYIWTRDRLYYTNDDEITSDPVQTIPSAGIFIDTYMPMETIADTGSLTYELHVNVLYKFENRTSNLVLTLGAEIPGVVNEYHMIIECGSTAPTITWPAQVSTAAAWYAGIMPVIRANTKYEVSILQNVATFAQL